MNTDDKVILDRLWFTNMHGTFGIVVIQDRNTNKRKAYIGAATGADEGLDTYMILNNGARFHLVAAERIVKLLKDKEAP